MSLTSVAHVLEPDYKEQFRDMIHDEADKWADQLLCVFDEDRQPTLMEMSELFTETRQKFLGSCLQKLIEQKYGDLLEQEQASCPKCGKLCKKRCDNTQKTVTMQGPFAVKRPWFYCTDCSLGFSPLDEALEVSRKKHQFDIQKKAVNLSADVTFFRGSEIFEDLTGQSISDHFIHETFESVGTEAHLEDVIPGREEIEKRINGATSGKWRPILVVASDGAYVPTRPKAGRSEKRGKGRWRDAKGFRIYLLSKDRIIHIASWHQIQDESEFGRDLAVVASRIPEGLVRIGLLGDGADWLWKHMKACFPQGREILDYYHCVEHICKVARIQYGENSIDGLQWVEGTISRLFFSEVGNVISGLRRMKPKTDEAKEKIRKFMGYLENNRKKIHYHGDRAGGYPIGSGGIESAHKFIVHTRMKRSGAWWVKETGNEMLRIRCAIYNGTYDKVFETYKNAHLPHYQPFY